MIYPIVIYGDPVLKKPAKTIEKDYPDLHKLIADMFETMEKANGVGLAAPQIGKSIRMFIVDATQMDNEETKDFKKVFINPEILEESEEEWKYEEGCLSIPGLREKVERPEEVHVRYQDENFAEHEETLSGVQARIFQHEYDHIEGILFTEKLSAFKKSLIKGRLNAIAKGDFDAQYAVKLYNPKRKK
jgi:peptide deformylase